MSRQTLSRVGAAASGVAMVIACAAPASAAAAPSTHRTHYQQARTQWQAGSHTSAADAGRYWLRAARDLDAAPGNRFSAERRELRWLIRFPNTGLTKAQIHHVRHVTHELDKFFHTPDLYL